MRNSYLMGHLFNRPHAVWRGKLEMAILGFRQRLGVREQPRAFEDDDDYDRISSRPYPGRRPYQVTGSGVAIIPIRGVLVHRAGQMDLTSEPLRSYEAICSDLAMAANDPAVRAVVLDADTPGGECTGVSATGRAIADLASVMPVIACANGYALSAGMWLASAADAIVVDELGAVGSIGVVAAHLDMSGADAKEGLAYRYYFQGDHKVDLNPHQAPTPDAEAQLMADIQDAYGKFTAFVAEQRGMTVEEVVATQARVYFGERAVTAGLADAVGTLSDAIGMAEDMADEAESEGRGNPARASTVRGSRMNQRMTGAKGATGARIAAQDPASSTPPAPPPADPPPAPPAGDPPPADPAPEPPQAPPPPSPEPSNPPPPPASAAVVDRAEAAAIVELCNVAGQPQRAAGFLREGKTRGEVSEALLRARAEEGGTELTRTAHGIPVVGMGHATDRQPAAALPAGFDPRAVARASLERTGHAKRTN